MQITVQNIHAGYGPKTILRDVSHSFSKGRVTALIGPNGCGKSTLLRAIMGFVETSSGSIRLGGTSVTTLGRKEFARNISYLPQEAHCPDYISLGELIELGGSARNTLFGGASDDDRALYCKVLDIVGLSDKVNHSVNSLSGGERQRAWIALVLAQDTDIILMDEPVNHLDIKYQYAVLGLIRSLSTVHGKTVIVVLHDINLTAAFADEVIMLKQGQVVTAGALEDTLTSANIEHVFDIAADMFARKGRLICQPVPHRDTI